MYLLYISFLVFTYIHSIIIYVKMQNIKKYLHYLQKNISYKIYGFHSTLH